MITQNDTRSEEEVLKSLGRAGIGNLGGSHPSGWRTNFSADGNLPMTLEIRRRLERAFQEQQAESAG